MKLDKINSNHLPFKADLTIENSPDPDNDQAFIEALERYLRRSSLARACPFPRWVRW